MKKLLFTLLTAACFAGVASAITDSWTASTTTHSNDTDSYYYNDGDPHSSFSIAVVFNIEDLDSLPTSSGNMLLYAAYRDLGTNSDYFRGGQQTLQRGSNYVLATNGGVYGKGVKSSISNWTDANTTDTYVTDYLKEGQNVVVLSGVKSDDSSSVTYTLYVNAKFDANGNVISGTALTTTVDTDSYGSGNWYHFGATTDYDSEFYYMMDTVATTADIASLPEPTALALLALGAAGLALRRKAA